MKCPIDNIDLVMSDRQGIEIDYCPKCRGVWLDRGELDKIIERSDVGSKEQPRMERSDARPRDEDRYRQSHNNYDREERYDDDDYRNGRRRKESFLSDIFDF